MRIHFRDLVRPKQAAKRLARLTSGSLAETHEALARVLGYRSWHEFALIAQAGASHPAVTPDLSLSMTIILELADALTLPDAEIQYEISRARLLSSTPWSIEEQLWLRSSIWRLRLFGPPGRNRPGTIVSDKAYGSKMPAYLLRAGRPTYLLFDAGLGTRADFEISTPRVPLPDFVPARLWLPYGHWTLADGSEVLFSRDYLPMWHIAGNHAERLAPWLWIKGIAAEHHFLGPGSAVWAAGPARQRAVDYLATRRIFELPTLTDIMPHLFDERVGSIEEAVAFLYKSRAGGEGVELPGFAELNRRAIGRTKMGAD